MPKGSRVIFISSSLSASSTVTAPYAVYLPSKGSIEQLARVLAKTLGAAPYNILVNTVSPGPTATELFFEGKSEPVIRTFEGLSPFGRLGRPEEIAEAIGECCFRSIEWSSRGGEGRWLKEERLKVEEERES
ncbi:hypothetical protein BDY24DRAFT_386772 [Mrakia frigida]|uniref:uncharacterized protein n=1 Tax=Mrakia frigida TaxID=29902 RepID=UPI003FCBF498